MPKLLILSHSAKRYRELIEAARLPELDIMNEPGEEVEVVFGEPDRIRQVLDSLPRLKWAQATWAGVEPLLDPALRRDYILTNARGVFGPLISEFVFGYLLLHERRMLEHLESQRQHKWNKITTGTLRGKTLGLLGVGSIGADLANTAKHFNLTVHGFTRGSESCPDVDRYFHSSLADFASGLDYLVCVLPNTRSTRNLVNAEVLAALPRHALVVNVGRGQTLDEAALAKALREGQLGGAILDVFQEEPLPPNHFLWDTPNILITSHTSGPSFPEDLSKVFIENYLRYIEGLPLLHLVDFERGY